jgi:uncharacterized protein YkwD
MTIPGIPARGDQQRLPRRGFLVALAAPAAMLAAPVVARADDLEARIAQELDVLFWNVNGVRNLYGLSHLHLSPRLSHAARTHAEDMAAHGFFAHNSSDGTDWAARIHGFYPYETWLGENIAAGFSGGIQVLDAWRASPAHNEILLTPDFNAIGLGCFASGDRWYWTADFGGLADS